MEQFESLLKRPTLYCNTDGVLEIGMGAMCLGCFALMWMQAHSGDHSVWLNPWVFTGYIALMSAGLYFGIRTLCLPEIEIAMGGGNCHCHFLWRCNHHLIYGK